MKKIIAVLFLLTSLCIGARAQVFILNDNIFQGRMSNIKTAVLDSLTNEPVAFASVYVIPSKDTTITNFTLTDAKGVATLEEVPYGSYVLHVEMMGYKPFVKERYFREEEVDMGTIKLKVDENFLEAAKVTDVGNPIVVKKDTVEFNASSFRVGANAMLKDLLQRMPGMEITEDGKVKFNGEEIDKLTVGGRTFFFNDQSTALNNLPASIVDKIRVIDRESEQTRASGLQDGNREKVLDVALKKEYQEGWFGNVGLKGGTTFAKKDTDDPLRDDRGFLYNGNALVSAYTEKDQVTLIGNLQNVTESNAIFILVDNDGEETSSLDQGLSTAAQLGLNVNTTRIKDVETTVGGNYKYSDSVNGSRAERTTFQEDGDLKTASETSGRQFVNTVTTSVEMKKEKGKFWFRVLPDFRISKTNSFSDGSSETTREGLFVNRSDKSAQNQSVRKEAYLYSILTFRELWGKEDRTLQLTINTDYDKNNGESRESSELTTAGGLDSRLMRYDSDGLSTSAGGAIRYTEPLGNKWSLSTSASFSWNGRNSVRDAFDAVGRNDFYSSVSQSTQLDQGYGLTAQYKFGEDSWVTVGGSLNGILQETFSKSYGIEKTTGKDEWNWFLTPTVRFQHTQGYNRYEVFVSGYTQRASSSRMQPVLNIADPSRLSVGNVYLKPYSYTYLSLELYRNNREKFSSLIAYLFGQVNVSPITQAQWYDGNGILYSVPVNTRKPGYSISGTVNFTTPLGSKRNWSLSLIGSPSFTSSVSYQARTALPGLDKDAFDYSAFMDDFWGNAEGNRFYGGASGFEESRTHFFEPYAAFSVKYNQDRYSFTVGANMEAHIARYSLDPSANLNTLDTRFRGRASYTTKHEIEFNNDLSYVFYKGYPEGYGQPEWQWDIEINKSIGAFNLSVSAHDILNQTRNLTHTVTANYKEDTYRLVMGRYVLFGVKWNFGKMNAAHSQRAQQAAMDLVW